MGFSLEIKRFFQVLAIFVVMITFSPRVYAGTDQSFQMGAGVAESISLAMDIFQTSTISEGTKVTSGIMDFGNLVFNETSKTYHGGTWFTVIFWPSSNTGKQWELKMTAASMTDAGTGQTLPDGACIFDPWPTDHNGQAFPTGSTKGTRGSIVGTNQLLFKSNATGAYASVPVTFAISDDPGAGATEYITGNQRAGTYKSTIYVNMTSVA